MVNLGKVLKPTLRRFLTVLWAVPLWMVQVRLLDCVFDKCIAFPSGVATLGLPSTGALLHVFITRCENVFAVIDVLCSSCVSFNQRK